MPTIAIVDDDPELRELLADFLGGAGFEVALADCGARGLEVARGGVDLVVLDVMLPDQSGLDVLRALRKQSAVPVVMLTARGTDIDRIVGLEVGADDYVPKPFNPRELLARVHAVLRRTQGRVEGGRNLTVGPLRLDVASREAELDGETLTLTASEFELLRVLMENAGAVLEREQLFEAVKGQQLSAFDRAVDVHISNLRRKLGDDARRARFIKTVHGFGYFMPREVSAP